MFVTTNSKTIKKNGKGRKEGGGVGGGEGEKKVIGKKVNGIERKGGIGNQNWLTDLLFNPSVSSFSLSLSV